MVPGVQACAAPQRDQRGHPPGEQPHPSEVLERGVLRQRKAPFALLTEAPLSFHFQQQQLPSHEPLLVKPPSSPWARSRPHTLQPDRARPCLGACKHACVRACACAFACVCVCMRVRLRACAFACARARACVLARVVHTSILGARLLPPGSCCCPSCCCCCCCSCSPPPHHHPLAASAHNYLLKFSTARACAPPLHHSTLRRRGCSSQQAPQHSRFAAAKLNFHEKVPLNSYWLIMIFSRLSSCTD